MIKIPLFSKPTVPLAVQIKRHLEEIRTKQVQISLQMNQVETLVHLLEAHTTCACGDHFDAENPGYCGVCAATPYDKEVAP